MMEKLEIPMPESGMEVIYDEATLKEYIEKAVGVTPDRPLLIDLGSGTAKATVP